MNVGYPELNVEMIRRVRDHIVDHPEQHDQRDYKSKCGTTQCVAGWALTFSGYTTYHIRGWDDLSSFWSWSDPSGETALARPAAREVLGLDEFEANVLFLGADNQEAVQILNNLLAGRRGDDACGFVVEFEDADDD